MISGSPISSTPISGEISASAPTPPPPETGISATLSIPWRGLVSVEASLVIPWSGLSTNPIEASLVIPWRGLSGSATDDATISPVILNYGRVIDYLSLSLTTDEDSSLWEFQAEIANSADWLALNIGTDISVMIGSEDYHIVIDGRAQSDDGDYRSHIVSGRSPAAELANGSAAVHFDAGTTSGTLAVSVAGAAGITLDWQTIDWVLPGTEIGSEMDSPMDRIAMLAEAIGAVVQSAPDGTVIVRPRYPVSPSQYESASPESVISDITQIFSISETYEHRSGQNRIDVMDEGEGNPTYQWETSSEGAIRVLSLWISPWRNVTLKDSGGGHLTALYQGIITDALTEEIEIVDGRGSVSKPSFAVSGASWKYVDLGAISIAEGGEVTTGSAGNSLVDVSFHSKRHVWRCEANVPRVQVYIEE